MGYDEQENRFTYTDGRKLLLCREIPKLINGLVEYCRWPSLFSAIYAKSRAVAAFSHSATALVNAL